MIEVRDYGDKKTIVLYTDESSVASRVRNWRECLRVVPYEQVQIKKKRLVLVGSDTYLPRSKRILKRIFRGFSNVVLLGTNLNAKSIKWGIKVEINGKG